MWVFEQSTGKLFDSTGKQRGHGYAGGNCGKNPEGINNPAMQIIPRVGPLPVGRYAMAAPVDDDKLGPFAIPLIPAKENIMFGRGGFFCHGDTVPGGKASEGCIIMPRVIRRAMWNSNDHLLSVVAKV